jgi:hypothetical protein
MSAQPETVKIARPFKALLKDKGWVISNINPTEFTDCLPDCIGCHARFGVRFIEFKINYNGHVHLTKNQKVVFPKLMSNGMPIYCIAAEDLRGEENYHLRQRMYNKLFDKPNGEYMLLSTYHHLLF